MEHGVGIEQGDEGVKVSIARGGDESFNDFLLCGRIGVGGRVRTADAAASAAGELARHLGRAVEDGADLLEGDGEHVVQDVGEPLRRRQRLEHDEQRQPDGVGEQRLVVGVDAFCALDDRVRQEVCVEWLLASRLA